MDDRAIQVTFRYSEREYVEALRAHTKSRMRLPMDAAVVAVCVIGGVYSLRTAGQEWVGYTLLIAAGVFVLVLALALFVTPTLVFRNEPKYKDEYQLTFATEGIHFKTDHIDSSIQWSLYSKALVIPNSYIFYHGQRTISVIPKRVFDTPEKLKAFESLVSEKIPKIVRVG